MISLEASQRGIKFYDAGKMVQIIYPATFHDCDWFELNLTIRFTFENGSHELH